MKRFVMLIETEFHSYNNATLASSNTHGITVVPVAL